MRIGIKLYEENKIFDADTDTVNYIRMALIDAAELQKRLGNIHIEKEYREIAQTILEQLRKSGN